MVVVMDFVQLSCSSRRSNTTPFKSLYETAAVKSALATAKKIMNFLSAQNTKCTHIRFFIMEFCTKCTSCDFDFVRKYPSREPRCTIFLWDCLTLVTGDYSCFCYQRIFWYKARKIHWSRTYTKKLWLNCRYVYMITMVILVIKHKHVFSNRIVRNARSCHCKSWEQ